MSRLEELRELAQWQFSDWRAEPDEDGWWHVVGSGGLLLTTEADGPQAERLAKFIAQANPETVLALIALVEELSAALTDFTSEWGFDACRATDDGTCRECSVSWPCPTERVRAALASAATWMED